MARITHPRPTLGRTRPGVGGVVFQDGVAEVDLTDKPILHDFYLRHGYKIDYDIDELAADVNVPLSSLTIKELHKVAADNRVEVSKSIKLKDELVEFVESALARRKLMADGSALGVADEDLDEFADLVTVVAESAGTAASAAGVVPVQIKIDRDSHTLTTGSRTRAELLELAGRPADDFDIFLALPGGDHKLDEVPVLLADGSEFYTAPKHING